MRSSNFLAAAVAGLGLIATAALAQEAENMDADGDGVYSYEELVAAYPDLNEETFLSVDANADGMVDEDELAMARDGGLLPLDG